MPNLLYIMQTDTLSGGSIRRTKIYMLEIWLKNQKRKNRSSKLTYHNFASFFYILSTLTPQFILNYANGHVVRRLKMNYNLVEQLTSKRYRLGVVYTIHIDSFRKKGLEFHELKLLKYKTFNFDHTFFLHFSESRAG